MQGAGFTVQGSECRVQGAGVPCRARETFPVGRDKFLTPRERNVSRVKKEIHGRERFPFLREVTSRKPTWRQIKGKWMVSLFNSHKNATSKRQYLWEIDLGFAPGFPPGWYAAAKCEMGGLRDREKEGCGRDRERK